jgi:uncharacterized membrane protein YcgQ (UPF0703/DUF1980 family)
MKEKITAFIQGLISYDYILFASAFTLFILLIVASILLRRKVGLSIFVLLLSFSVLFLGPTIGYIKMHQFLFKNSVTLTSQILFKRLLSKELLKMSQILILKAAR